MANYPINNTLMSSVGNYTTGFANGSSYTNVATNAAVNNYSMGDHVLTVKGDPASLEVKGKVVINGLDLEERLKTIEKVLMIPERDAIMETKYPSLKKKYDDYVNTLAKYRTWEAIKGDSNGTT